MVCYVLFYKFYTKKEELEMEVIVSTSKTGSTEK